MGTKVNAYINRELKKNRFSFIFFNWNISVNNCGNLMKFGRHVVKVHSEGTMSQIFYLASSFNFMNSRNLSLKK